MSFKGMEKWGRRIVAGALLIGAGAPVSAQTHLSEKKPVKSENKSVKPEYSSESKHKKVTQEEIQNAELNQRVSEMYHDFFGSKELSEKMHCDFPERNVVTNAQALKALLDTGFHIEEKNVVLDSNEDNTHKAERLSKKYADAYANIDKQLDWLADVMESEEYQFKAMVNEELSVDAYKKRLELVKKSKGNFIVLDNLEERLFKNNEQLEELHKIGHAMGFRDKSNGMNYVDIRSKDTTTVLHEAQHTITDGNMNLSEFAKKLYDESFIAPSDTATLEEIVYLKKSTERDARKKELEYDMDRLNIKKYGDPFTKECFDKLMKYKKDGLLNSGSVEFLETTKPEYLENIFNWIAYQKSGSSNDSESSV